MRTLATDGDIRRAIGYYADANDLFRLPQIDSAN